MRGSQQHPPVLHGMPIQHHPAFVDGDMSVSGGQNVAPIGTNMGVDIVATPQDANRRSSVYPDYNTVNNSNLYAQQWQPGSSSSDTQPAYHSQASHQAQPYVQQVTGNNHSGYHVPNTFVETMPRQGYDPNNGQLFRPGEVSHPSVGSQQGYSYLQNDARGMPSLPGVSEVIDSAPRGPM